MNLMLGINNGDGCQDSFEGIKCFGWSLGEIVGKCSTPRSPVNQASLLDCGSGQYGLSCTQDTKTHPRTPQTGLGYDHHRMFVQERSLKVAERPVPGPHALPDHEYSSPSHQSRDQECCDQVARSALPQSPCVCVFAPAVLSRRGMNIAQQELSTALTCIAALISRS